MPSLPLQPRLDDITAQTRKLVQAERLAVTDNFIADLLSSGLESRILPAGSPFPAFALPDATTGKQIRSADLLALGPLVVVFFRGRWDPYCMTTLEAWQASYPALRERNALLVAISPQLPRQNAFAAEQHHLTFPLLTDKTLALASELGLTYSIPEPMQHHYRSMLVNLPFINADPTWRLALPATFVVDTLGFIRYAEAHADHRVRPDPADILNLLDNL
jgi:peroxiredoxin